MNKELTGVKQQEYQIELQFKLEDKWPVITISEEISDLGYDKGEFLDSGLGFGAIFKQDEFERLDKSIKEHFQIVSDPIKIESSLYTKQGQLQYFTGQISKKGDRYSFTLTYKKQVNNCSDYLKAYKMASLIGAFYIFEYHIDSKKLYIDWQVSDVGSDDPNIGLQELPNWIDLISEKDRPGLINTIEQAVSAQCDIANLELEMFSPLGYFIQVSFSARLIKDDSGRPQKLVGVLIDVSKYKKAIAKKDKVSMMLNTLLEIIRQKDLSRDEMLKYAMEKAIEFTNSKIGYIYLYNEKTEKFTLINWSKEVMAQCKVTDPQTEYELEKTGIWGEVVRQRKSMILNDFSQPNELVKGIPQGHVPLKRWCAIPVIYRDKIVATLGVANSDHDYKEEDVELLTQLMEGIWDYIVDQALSKEIESKEKTLDSYVNLAPMIILSLDKNGIVVNINKPGAEILGGKQEEIVGKNWFENFLPDSLAVKMRSVFEQSTKGAEIEKDAFTHEVLTLQKQIKVILWKNVLITDEAGKFKMMLSTGQDVTEREMLLKELEVNKGKFEQYIKEAPIGIYVANRLGQYKEVNAAGCKFLGYTKEELLNKSIGDMVIEQDRSRALEAFKVLISEGKIEEQYSFLRKDGNVAVGSLNAVKIDDDTLLAFVVDITQQMNTSEELKKQNQELGQMNNLMIERELKMRQLKAEIAALKAGKAV